MSKTIQSPAVSKTTYIMMRNESIIDTSQQLRPERQELIAFYNRLDSSQKNKWQSYCQEILGRDFQALEIVNELNSLSEKQYRQLITYTRLLLWA